MLNKLLVSALFPFSIWQMLATVKEVVANSAHHEQSLLCSPLVLVDNLILESKHVVFTDLLAWRMCQEIVNGSIEFFVSDLSKGFIDFVRKPVP